MPPTIPNDLPPQRKSFIKWFTIFEEKISPLLFRKCNFFGKKAQIVQLVAKMILGSLSANILLLLLLFPKTIPSEFGHEREWWCWQHGLSIIYRYRNRQSIEVEKRNYRYCNECLSRLKLMAVATNERVFLLNYSATKWTIYLQLIAPTFEAKTSAEWKDISKYSLRFIWVRKNIHKLEKPVVS